VSKKGVFAGIVLASASLVALVTGWEGNETTTYADIVGIPTVCSGITDPSIAIPGKTYSAAECESMNAKEIEEHGERALQCVNVTISQGEYEAYASLAYNIGTNNFCKSTLVRKLNAGDRAGACAEILRWNRAGGKVVRGLDNRRKAEHGRCLKALEPAAPTGPRALA
jgi:lysozyme